jgi:hypothetical protein
MRQREWLLNRRKYKRKLQRIMLKHTERLLLRELRLIGFLLKE